LKTSGQLIKHQLGLDNFPNIKISRLLGHTYPLYLIYYNSHNLKLPILRHTVAKAHFTSKVFFGTDSFKKSAMMTPLIDLDKFNGLIRGALFTTIDIAGYHMIDKNRFKKVKEGKENVESDFDASLYYFGESLEKIVEDGFSIPDLFNNVSNPHELEFYNDRQQSGSHVSNITQISWNDKNWRALGADKNTSTLTITFKVSPTYGVPKFVFKKDGGKTNAPGYTIRVQFQDINAWVESRFAFLELEPRDQVEFMDAVLKLAPVKLWSNDPSWMFRGSYENATDLGYSMYDFHKQGIPTQDPSQNNSAYNKYYRPYGEPKPAIFTLSKHMIEVLKKLPDLSDDIIRLINKKYGD